MEKLVVTYLSGYDPAVRLTVNAITPFKVKTIDGREHWVQYIYIEDGEIVFQVSENF